MISKQYLADRGYLDSNGYFDFNWAEDRFIINGIPYRPTGDTNVSQAKDEAIVFLIILKRDRDSFFEEDWQKILDESENEQAGENINDTPIS